MYTMTKRQELAAHFWENPGIKELEIGYYADSSLPTLPDSLRKIYLHDSHHLRFLSRLPRDLTELRVFHCSGLTELDLELPALKKLDINLCNGIENIEAPVGICYMTIKCCFGLRRVVAPSQSGMEGVEFVNCPDLSYVELPNALKALAIKYCRRLPPLGHGSVIFKSK